MSAFCLATVTENSIHYWIQQNEFIIGRTNENLGHGGLWFPVCCCGNTKMSVPMHNSERRQLTGYLCRAATRGNFILGDGDRNFWFWHLAFSTLQIPVSRMVKTQDVRCTSSRVFGGFTWWRQEIRRNSALPEDKKRVDQTANQGELDGAYIATRPKRPRFACPVKTPG